MDYAINLLIPFLLCLYVGYWLDQKLGWTPWLTILGTILGMVLGIGVMYKRSVLEQKRLEREKQNQQAVSRQDEGK